MMKLFKDDNNVVHEIENGFEHLLPVGCTEVTRNEADALIESAIVPPTYQELRAAEYPPMTDYMDGVVKGDAIQQQAYIDACLAVKEKYPKPI